MHACSFVLLAADTRAAHSILVFKADEDKITKLDSHKLMASAGDHADRTVFAEYIEKNMALYELNNNTALSTNAAANYIRTEIANSLRSRRPYQTNMLIGGVDGEEPSLYFMDYLGAMQKVPYGCHGYGGYFCLSIMDQLYQKDMTLEQAKDIMQKLFQEMNSRFLIAQPTFLMKLITKDGISVVE